MFFNPRVIDVALWYINDVTLVADVPKALRGKPLNLPSLFILISLIFIFWISCTSQSEKILCVLCAMVYSFLEYGWYALTVLRSDGSVVFAPFAKNHRGGHTTIHQYMGNVFYMPFFIYGYDLLLVSLHLPGPLVFWKILFFPLNVWMLETVEGYILMFMFGYNPAWFYVAPRKWVFCHGNIILSYWPQWMLLGLLYQLLAAFLSTFKFEQF